MQESKLKNIPKLFQGHLMEYMEHTKPEADRSRPRNMSRKWRQTDTYNDRTTTSGKAETLTIRQGTGEEREEGGGQVW